MRGTANSKIIASNQSTTCLCSKFMYQNLPLYSCYNNIINTFSSNTVAKTGIIVSASVSAIIITVCIAVFITVTVFLIRIKLKLQAELATCKSVMTQNFDEVIQLSQDTVDFSTRKNIAYSVHTPRMKKSSGNIIDNN